jgi:hypothetical protein
LRARRRWQQQREEEHERIIPHRWMGDGWSGTFPWLGSRRSIRSNSH